MTLTTIKEKNKVYGTFDETICYTKEYTNENEYQDALTEARGVCFGYGMSVLNVMLRHHEDLTIETNDQAFNFLSK